MSCSRTTGALRAVPLVFRSVLVLAVWGVSCVQAADVAHNADVPSRSLKALERFRFFVYPKPLDLSSDFHAKALKGEALVPSLFKGKVTLLNFWATWCPPCRVEMPSMDRMQALMRGNDFQIVAVNVGDSRKQVESFIARGKHTFPIYLDEEGSLGSVFASRGLPTTYVVDKAGRIVAVVVGSVEYDQPELVALFKELARD